LKFSHRSKKGQKEDDKEELVVPIEVDGDTVKEVVRSGKKRKRESEDIDEDVPLPACLQFTSDDEGFL
jgi:hypothetical protein